MLKGVVIAFAVSAGQIGIASCCGLEQRWILYEDVIGGVAVTGPKFVGALLIPCYRRLCAVDLKAEPVLASGGNLAGNEAAAGPSSHLATHVKNHCAEVLRVHGGFNVVRRAENFVGKSFDGMFWLLACGMEGLQIGAERSHMQSSDMFGHVKPVRADVGHAPRRASGFGVDAPIPIGVVEQPVLGVCALHDEDFAQVSVFA